MMSRCVYARRGKRAITQCFGGAFLLLMTGSLSAQVLFTNPQLITDGSADYQLSRNPNQSMAFDSTGMLHVTYWSGDAATTIASPSAIHYRHWSPVGGWSPQEDIDDSYYDTGSELVKYGGRHPSLAVSADDTLWVVWMDHRHSNPVAPGNGIDNTEIYADSRPSGGFFSSTDLRLTTSSAAHQGDNGFTPKVVAFGNRVSVIWHDFNADYGISDIYIKHSDASGVFNLSETMADMRLTNKDDRGGSGAVGYSVPDLVVDSAGNLTAIWTSGFGPPAPVYTADPAIPTSVLTASALASDTGAYFDPPKIAIAPNDDIWVVYTNRAGGEDDVYAVRRQAGNSSFDTPIPLKATSGVVEESPDLEIDSDGILHFVWADERDGRNIYYGTFDPDTSQLLSEEQLTDGDGKWERPTLALDGDGYPSFLFEENISSSLGDIWFVRGAPPLAAETWNVYP